MTSVTAKYPIKIGNTLVPKGTVGFIPNEPSDRIKSTFPNLVPNKDSQQVLVKFPNVDECIVHRTQVII